MQAIYVDPTPSKKRSYNFGISKIFQFGIHEHDTNRLKDKLIQDVKEIVQ